MFITVSLLHFAFRNWHVQFGWTDMEKFILISVKYNAFYPAPLTLSMAQVAQSLINVHALHGVIFTFISPLIVI